MTFISEHDLDMVVTYLHAKIWVNRSSGSKVIIRIQTHTETDRQGVKPLPTSIGYTGGEKVRLIFKQKEYNLDANIHEVRPIVNQSRFNPWSPGGSFMVQKMAITSPIPIL